MTEKPSTKQRIVDMWNEGKSLDLMVKELQIQGFTTRAGNVISKSELKRRLTLLLDSKVIKKRKVVQYMKAS